MNNSEKKPHSCGEDILSDEKNPYEDFPTENKIVISELDIDEELPPCKDTVSSRQYESDSFSNTLFSLLAEGNYTQADRLCREELIRTPSGAKAHLGLLMCHYQIPTKEELAQSDEFFSENEHYLALLKSDDLALSEEVKAYANCVGERLYQVATDKLEKATTPDDFYHAARLFEELPGFKDSAQKALDCKQKGDYAKKSAVYKKAVERLRFSEVWPPTETTAQAYEASISELKTIPDWEDAKEKLAQYQARLYDIRLTMEKRGDFSGGKTAKKKGGKHTKKIVVIIASLLVLICGISAGFLLINTKEKAENHTILLNITEENCEEQYHNLLQFRELAPVKKALEKFVWMPSEQLATGANAFISFRFSYEYEPSLNFIDGKFTKAEFTLGPSNIDSVWFPMNMTSSLEVRYDENGNKTKEVSFRNSSLTTITYTYDKDGRCTEEVHTDKEGTRTITHRYNSDGTKKNSVSRDDSGNKTTYEYVYGSNGEIEKEVTTTPEGEVSETLYEYDEYGNILSHTGTLGLGTNVVEYKNYKLYYIGE